jgi:GNAT superfamily N-acetyltransferase
MQLHPVASIDKSRFSKVQAQTNAKNTFVKPNRAKLLTEANKQEVLNFLAKRPVHTVVMSSFIQDNGMEGAANRGKFYGYRNSRTAKLEGVALIGHTTLVESRSKNSLASFALAARLSETPIHIVMSDGKSVETFWEIYAAAGQKPRVTCTELLFELSFPFLKQQCAWEVRPAKAVELEQIAEAHAEVAFAESGVDPMIRDREGFLKRCLNRIEKGRTFVVFENGKLVFKADIVAETADVIYLEGIYVAPEFRGRNVASQCLAKLGSELLNRVEHICLLSNVELKGAHRSFLKAGFRNTDSSTTIFV